MRSAISEDGDLAGAEKELQDFAILSVLAELARTI